VPSGERFLRSVPWLEKVEKQWSRLRVHPQSSAPGSKAPARTVSLLVDVVHIFFGRKSFRLGVNGNSGLLLDRKSDITKERNHIRTTNRKQFQKSDKNIANLS